MSALGRRGDRTPLVHCVMVGEAAFTAPAERLRAGRSDHVCALHFQFEPTADGRLLKMLNIDDETAREPVAIVLIYFRRCVAQRSDPWGDVAAGVLAGRERLIYAGQSRACWWCRSRGR